MITDFPAANGINLGGYAQFEFTPYYFVDNIPGATGKKIIAAISFVDGYRFYVGYSTQETLSFKEPAQTGESGIYYKPSIKGFIPGDSPELAQLMEDIENVSGGHLVKITDYQGKVRLAGIDAPLEFTSDFNSGDQPGSEKGYSFEFYGEALARAPFYDPAGESDES